jgi:hypothetical protein
MIPMFGTSGTRWSQMTKTPVAISLIAFGLTTGGGGASLDLSFIEQAFVRISRQGGAIGHFKLKTSSSGAKKVVYGGSNEQLFTR